MAAVAERPRPDRPLGGSLRRKEARIGLLFVLPCLLLFVVFRFGPGVAGLLLAFTDYTPGAVTHLTGLENFRRLWDDPLFWSSLRVTVVYTVLAVPAGVAASLGLALLTRRAFRGSKLFRSVFFLPVVTSLVLASTVFVWIFSTDGPWSAVMGFLGLPSQNWLSDSVLVLPALALVGIWSRCGYGMLILLARMQELPVELEEAALVDGAGPVKRFRYIVAPQLKPAFFFLAVIETTVSFQVFDAVYMMTGGGPANASYSLVFQLYDTGFKYFDFGYASAIGCALFLLTIVVALVQRAVLGKEK
ncbi:sugar ABC transporter permease [Streptomyces griseoviridis]|uniref:Sugar ABC transporter permease n=2 Tax=Streptomyces TaxID=1883 RepID=A0A3S9ZNL2_STRGD|nr:MULTISPECIES: sugar ABC transporter permease [Streptomyces]AZS89485.1 sugar ABC transporter permease [Streptomyces griseoviridis]MDT0473783.1 sugar ABC transporter permease [Streptomyces sp. DSM 41014]QCN83674.1 sugar ABC transporter permease [Streptomyces griseoviridis]